MLKNELSLARDDVNTVRTNADDDELSRRSLERKLKEKEWELRDTVAIKDAR